MRLRYGCLLFGNLRARRIPRSRCRFDLAGNLFGLRPIFAGIEFSQRLPLPNRLILDNEHPFNISGDLGRCDDGICRNIGVVGHLHVSAPVLMIQVPDKATDEQQDRANEHREANARRFKRRHRRFAEALRIRRNSGRLVRHINYNPNVARCGSVLQH